VVRLESLNCSLQRLLQEDRTASSQDLQYKLEKQHLDRHRFRHHQYLDHVGRYPCCFHQDRGQYRFQQYRCSHHRHRPSLLLGQEVSELDHLIHHSHQATRQAYRRHPSPPRLRGRRSTKHSARCRSPTWCRSCSTWSCPACPKSNRCLHRTASRSAAPERWRRLHRLRSQRVQPPKPPSC